MNHGYTTFKSLFWILKIIQQPVRHKAAVGVNGGDADAAGQQRIHDLQEIPAHQRFTAGQGDLHHAAVDQLLHDGHDRLVGQLAVFRVRRGHVAVLAAVVAVPGDGPVRRADVACRIEPVFLTCSSANPSKSVTFNITFVTLHQKSHNCLYQPKQEHIHFSIIQNVLIYTPLKSPCSYS